MARNDRKLFLRALRTLVFVCASSTLLVSGRDKAQAQGTAVQEIWLRSRIDAIVSDRIGPKRYVAAIIISGDSAAIAEKTIKMPLAPYPVTAAALRSQGPAGATVDASTLDFSIKLTVDSSIRDGAVAALVEVLTPMLAIDGQRRSLTVVKADLSDFMTQSESLPKASVAQAQLQQQRLEADFARAQLETERVKLEATQKQIEADKKLESLSKLLTTAQQEAAPSKLESPSTFERITQISSRLQVAIAATILALSLVIFAWLVAKMLNRSISTFTDGMKATGAGLGDAVTRTFAPRADIDGQSSPLSASATGSNPEADRALAAKLEHWRPGMPDHDSFLRAIIERIDLLSREKSAALSRIIQDIAASPTGGGLDMLLSVLMALPPTTMQTIVQGLPPEATQALQAALRESGRVQRVKGLRAEALQDFFGRLAAEEFADSPLAGSHAMSWLSQLDSQGVLKTFFSFSEDERCTFLACLSPNRVAQLFKIASERERPAVESALSRISEVRHSQVDALLKQLESTGATNYAPLSRDQPVVQIGTYFTRLAEALPVEMHGALLAVASRDAAAARVLYQRIVPFDVVLHLPKELVSELFERHPPKRIAGILFAAPEDVKSRVLGALSKVKESTTQDELKRMAGGEVYQQKYQRESLLMQQEVGVLLAKMTSSGMIDIQQHLDLLREESAQKTKGASQDNLKPNRNVA